MKITLLITTYNRNQSLLCLFKQLRSYYVGYSGLCVFEMMICNSDKNHELPDFEFFMPTKIIFNEGRGFDINLLSSLIRISYY